MLSLEFLITSLIVVLIPGTGVIFTVSTALLQDHAGQRLQRERLLVDGERLATLLSAQGFAPTGGCALFQFCCTPSAAELHEFLASQGILTRLFASPLSLRFGLPADEAGWQRLQLGLEAFAMECQ